jgi:SAM-dependent methyltransferase
VTENVDKNVVAGFGYEWSSFSNDELPAAELAEMFEDYARIFPWESLPDGAVGFDAGCGSGRWAQFFAPRVGHLHCVDASADAIAVARRKLAAFDNVTYHVSDLDSMQLEPSSMDFGYSLGVLHHIPDTASATRACVSKLRPGAPFLVYLYYDLEGAHGARRTLLSLVTGVRWVVSRLPHRLRRLVTDAVAVLVYWPLARFARLVERMGRDPKFVPLFQYRNRDFYVMRNDALDRFGTRLEKRFSKADIVELLTGAGLTDITFSEQPPWWVAVGYHNPDQGG